MHHRHYRPEAVAGRQNQWPPLPGGPPMTTTDRQSEKQVQQTSCLTELGKQSLGSRAKQILPLVTCVFPPVLSCTRLLDIEQVMAKVWKKELMKLQRPRAISSWNTHVQVTGQCDGIHKFWLVPNESFCRSTGLQKPKKMGFLFWLHTVKNT